MSRSGRLVALLAVALTLAVDHASAQDRRGFTFGFGGGWGSANAECDDCGNGDREDSGAGYFKAGYALSPRVIVGFEANVWSKTYDLPGLEATSTVNMYNVSGTVTYYPQATGGFFVKGGGGGGFLNLEIKESGSTLSADMGKGPGFIAGAGYDIPLGRRVALTPAVNYWYGRMGNLRVLGETFATGWRQNVIDVTIGLTFP
ncbi:MAG: outer membrane beta-barrel protein [Vicinamibacterales bacterium]